MKKLHFISIILLLIFTMISCDEDDPIPTPVGPIESAVVNPEVGGANQPNQVYVDLSKNEASSVKRDSWDLGFYSGPSFRVRLNGSIFMATKQLSATDIDAVTTADVSGFFDMVAVGTFDEINMEFVDDVEGDINQTAIAEISATDDLNKVYLLNLGNEVGTETPATGSVALNGDPRGWLKIRVLRDGDNYKLQYAELDDITHQEVIITKDAEYNFTFFSFSTNTVVDVEPKKIDWDIVFTSFTNEIPGFGSYGYSDFVITNAKNVVASYQVDTDVTVISYDDFLLTDVVAASFDSSQRTIGSTWRVGGGPTSDPSIIDTVYYIVKDTEGNNYKLKFTALTSAEGVRGNPQFQYDLLQ